MTEREALKLALEAMTYADACLKKQLTTKGKHQYAQALLLEAGTAIKEALADPSPNFNCKSVQARLATAWGYVKAQPEPVACVTYKEVADTMNDLWGGTLVQRQIAEELENTMLYTTPPQRTWVGLTDVLDFIEEFTGAERERHPMFSDGYDLALSHVKELVEARLKEKNT